MVPRMIDRVTFDKKDKVTANSTIVDLYVVDMSSAPVQLEPELVNNTPWTSRQRFKYRQFLEVQKKRKWSAKNNIYKHLEKGWCMEPMRRLFTDEGGTKFVRTFEMGLHNYCAGEWSAARLFLDRSRTMLGFEDGPSATLLDLMEKETPADEETLTAPPGWKGFHSIEGMAKR